MSDVDVSKLVFLRFHLLKLARADAKLLPDERALLESVCPDEALRSRGLLNDDGTYTASFVAELDAARRDLPSRLSNEEKLEMITLFVEMAVIDGDLHHDEGVLLQEAATALVVDPEDFDRHLDGLTDKVGQLSGDDLETDD